MGELITLTAFDVAVLGDVALFVANEANLICSIDRRTENKSVWGSLPEEPLFSEKLVSRIIPWRNKLVFVPMNAKKIWIYDRDLGDWEGLLFRNGEWKRKFFQAVLYRDKVYMIGCLYPSVICLNLTDNSIRYMDGIMEEADSLSHISEAVYFRNSHVLIGAKLYLPSCKSNHLLKLDLETEEYQWIEIGKKDISYSGVAWDGNRFWMTQRKGKHIVVWNGKDTVFEKEVDVECPIDEVAFDESHLFLLCSQKTYVCADGDFSRIVPNKENYIFFREGERLSYEGIYSERNSSGENISWDIRIKREMVNNYICSCPIEDEETPPYFIENQLGMIRLLKAVEKTLPGHLSDEA